MSEKTSANSKPDLVEMILEIELPWFLNVNPQLTAECQEHPEAFKLMRQAPFETWSDQTLALHLKHISNAKSKDRNLIREKYAKIENSMPCVNLSPALNHSVDIEENWFKEATAKYPNIIIDAAREQFVTYLRCELDTFSQDTVDSYYKDRSEAKAEGKNLIVETYNIIAKKLGYNSIDEWNKQQG